MRSKRASIHQANMHTHTYTHTHTHTHMHTHTHTHTHLSLIPLFNFLGILCETLKTSVCIIPVLIFQMPKKCFGTVFGNSVCFLHSQHRPGPETNQWSLYSPTLQQPPLHQMEITHNTTTAPNGAHSHHHHCSKWSSLTTPPLYLL